MNYILLNEEGDDWLNGGLSSCRNEEDRLEWLGLVLSQLDRLPRHLLRELHCHYHPPTGSWGECLLKLIGVRSGFVAEFNTLEKSLPKKRQRLASNNEPSKKPTTKERGKWETTAVQLKQKWTPDLIIELISDCLSIATLEELTTVIETLTENEANQLLCLLSTSEPNVWELPGSRQENCIRLAELVILPYVYKLDASQVVGREMVSFLARVSKAQPIATIDGIVTPLILRAMTPSSSTVLTAPQIKLVKDMLSWTKQLPDRLLEGLFARNRGQLQLSAQLVSIFQHVVNLKPKFEPTVCTEMINVCSAYATVVKAKGDVDKFSTLLYFLVAKLGPKLDRQLVCPIISNILQNLPGGRMTKQAQQKLQKLEKV